MLKTSIFLFLFLVVWSESRSHQQHDDTEGEKSELIARGFSAESAIALVRIGEQNEDKVMSAKRNATEFKKAIDGAKAEMRYYLKGQPEKDQETFEHLFGE